MKIVASNDLVVDPKSHENGVTNNASEHSRLSFDSHAEFCRLRWNPKSLAF